MPEGLSMADWMCQTDNENFANIKISWLELRLSHDLKLRFKAPNLKPGFDLEAVDLKAFDSKAVGLEVFGLKAFKYIFYS